MKSFFIENHLLEKVFIIRNSLTFVDIGTDEEAKL